eukprot:TRINITY_DN12409_c0_g1_i1.p1 TRINITY_DN12409_c0_g1~~TRINITY_DN12409_c0_g1_i1.p1  ORF type:complete len:174 (-),score=37.03 TRINITY_DN12409_c0_g1_i1:177-698(-)
MTDTSKSELYLPPVEAVPTLTGEENLLEKFGLTEQYESLRKEEVPETFKPYISHLPGQLDEILRWCSSQKEGELIEKSFLRIALENLPSESATFPRFTDHQLRSCFTLQVGPIVRSDESKRKKRHRDKSEKKEKKKKKEKKDKKDKKEKKQRKEKKEGAAPTPSLNSPDQVLN